MHWAFLLLWRVSQSLPVKNSPTARAATSTLYFGMYSAGDERSRFPSNMMLVIQVHQIREYYFSQSEGPLGVFSCVFAEERIEFGLTAIKRRSVFLSLFALICIFQMLDLLLRRVPFQIIPINWICHRIPSLECTYIYKQYECSWAKCQRSQIRVITYATESFKIFIFNTFAKMLKTCFFALPFWCMERRLMWGENVI